MMVRSTVLSLNIRVVFQLDISEWKDEIQSFNTSINYIL